VLEKSRMNKEIGALISLQPNAQKIVDSWDIASYLAETHPMADEAFRILDTAGNIRMEIPLSEAKYGANRMMYHRQDLHTALRNAAAGDSLPGPPATIITAAKVIDCDCEAGVVKLEDGSTYQGDLVIGADGIHSAVRPAVLSMISSAAFKPKATSLSAYRLLLPTASISESLPVPSSVFDPKRPVTTLMMAYDRRIVMGPARDGAVLGMVCLVPDEAMHEESLQNSWTTPGSLDKLLETYKDFPPWIHELYKLAPDIALWQLRDLDALPTWVQGRTILIGDAAHAMLPTQGQGASQSIEDAEALQAFFADVDSGGEGPPLEKQVVEERLAKVFRARYHRASLIQAYSRQQAGTATAARESTDIKLNPAEFMDYNCNYRGAVAWLEAQEMTSQSA